MEKGIQSILEKGVVIPVPRTQEGTGFYSTLFLVPKVDGYLRPIMNWRHLNKFVILDPFRMITLHSIIQLIVELDFLVILDLQDAYFHVLIHQVSQPFFEVCISGVPFSTSGFAF